MKRPEGFDPQARRQPPTPPPVEKQERAARVPRAAKAPKERNPFVDDERAATRELREARRELRAAARDRKKFERGEVKRFTKRTRTRRAVITTAISMVVVLAVLFAVAVFSPLLALREITIEGTTRIDKIEVLEAVDGQLGTPLALVDLTRLESELATFPLIRSFVTETVPPNTLVIHIVEREPVGVVANGDRFDLVDPAGVVIQTVDERPDVLPLITASSESDVAFESIVEVLLVLPDDLLERVNTITATTKDDVMFRLRGDRQRVVWGSVDDSAEKARVLDILLGKKNAEDVREYDVRAPEAVVVKR